MLSRTNAIRRPVAGTDGASCATYDWRVGYGIQAPMDLSQRNKSRTSRGLRQRRGSTARTSTNACTRRMDQKSQNPVLRRLAWPGHSFLGRMGHFQSRHTAGAKRNHQYIVLRFEHVRQFPTQPLSLFIRQPAAENGVLHAMPVALQVPGCLPQAFWVSYIIADQPPSRIVRHRLTAIVNARTGPARRSILFRAAAPPAPEYVDN